MKSRNSRFFLRELTVSTLIMTMAACSSGSGSGGTPSPRFTFSGNLATTTASAASDDVSATVVKTVTHAMAIAPQSGEADRILAEVSTTGAFSLNVTPGRPYVIVFIASGQGFIGPEMIAGVFSVPANGLDSLAPLASGSARLGRVTIDGTAQDASSSESASSLLASLGLTSAEASFLGSVDDLTLRLANPDIDGNGVIDSLEDKNFTLDFHLRADTKVGGSNAKFSDAVNTFLVNPTLTFTLNSAYAVYPSTFYSGICPLNSGVDTTLTTGCSFDILNLAGSSVSGSWPRSSMSGGSFDDKNQWGPDFVPSVPQELPGSNGVGVQLVYGFPGGRSLTFWNVVTRTTSSLTADGTVIPFLRLNTSDNTSAGTMTDVQYKWMKKVSGTWVDATAAEVSLIVNEDGANVNFSTLRSGGVENGFQFSIPRTSPSGTIAWNEENINATGAVVSTATPASFCGSAVSYDDQLGLRIFAGSFEANAGTTPCP